MRTGFSSRRERFFWAGLAAILAVGPVRAMTHSDIILQPGDSVTITVATPPPAPPPPKYILPVDIASLPTSGPAWDAMLAAANSTWPAPDLMNQDSKHGLYVLAAALVYVRTGENNVALGVKADDAITAALATFHADTTNGALSLGRQLPAYVLAMDYLGWNDPDVKATLADWRDAVVGTHGRWNRLSFTYGDSSNNWGAHAGAAVVAIDRYLGRDIAADNDIFAGFHGWLAQHVFPKPSVAQPSWIAANAGTWTPVQQATGDPRDGAVTEDAWRAGAYPTISATYVMDSAQALALQAELLDGWSYLTDSSAFLKRQSSVWTSAGGRGGRGLAYLYNKRLNLGVPTTNLGDRMAWSLAWMDWLYQ